MEEMMKIKLLLIIILLIISGGIFYFFENMSSILYKNELDGVCQDYGYNKSTDSNMVAYRRKPSDGGWIQIECDGEVVKNKNGIAGAEYMFQIKSNYSKTCNKKNKWGDCISYKTNGKTYIKH